MHAIRIDRGKPLAEEPHVGHNRYHPDIPPVAEVAEGEEIALETRDALDGQITPRTTVADLASLDAGAVHPLTGPVFVKGTLWRGRTTGEPIEPGSRVRVRSVDGLILGVEAEPDPS